MTYAIYYKPNGDLFKLINKIQIQFIKKATTKKGFNKNDRQVFRNKNKTRKKRAVKKHKNP